MAERKVPHVMQEDAEVQTEKLRRIAVKLRKICIDVLEYPHDAERMDDLKDALLEGHHVLATLMDWFGPDG